MHYEFISIGLYFLLMLGIGYYSYRKSTNDMSEYMLGGRALGPAVTALSAGASDMSGWLLMGLPGAMYVSGISNIWIAVGLTVGAYLNYLLVAPRLRVYTEIANNSITIPDFFQNRFQDKTKMLRLISALVIFVFFTLYTSSGMVAGGTLFRSAFGLDYHLGLFATAGVVVFYTLFGGFMAVSLTDFIQGTIMMLALIIVPMTVIMELGGIGSTFETVRAINPGLLDLFKGKDTIAIISLLTWGLGYFGQPHIIVRFMAISSVDKLKTARRIGLGWMIFSVLGAMFIGFVGIAYVNQGNMVLENPEAIFIRLAQLVFHPLISGFLLSAILAAIMSTISSQLLVTSSAITEDLYRAFFRRNANEKELVLIGRLAVLLVAIMAIFLAYNTNENILNLVAYAWAGFGASFGPVVLFSLHWKRMTGAGALSGMIVGALTVLIWANSPLKDLFYEIIPGFIATSFTIIVVSLLTKKPQGDMIRWFDEVEKVIRSSKS